MSHVAHEEDADAQDKSNREITPVRLHQTQQQPIDRSQLGPPAELVTQKRVSSRVLLGGSKELIIEHQGREYRLRLTANGKLILTA